MTWLSPAYPVGGFSYSHGLEWVVETGSVRDAATLGDWIEDILRLGAGRTDAIFLAEAWRAVAGGDDASCLHEVAELAAAFAPSAERRLETHGAGHRVPHRHAGGVAARRCWRRSRPTACRSPIRWRSAPARPRTACRCRATAQAFVQAFAANLVSAGVRLIPLGQTDGLRVIARLEPLIPAIVAARAGRRASTTSAAPPSRPTSPPCATRRSTRGCSAPEA